MRGLDARRLIRYGVDRSLATDSPRVLLLLSSRTAATRVQAAGHYSKPGVRAGCGLKGRLEPFGCIGGLFPAAKRKMWWGIDRDRVGIEQVPDHVGIRLNRVFESLERAHTIAVNLICA